ncbi:TadE/TadG family type IV pilus assembly protein [Pseudomonas batumici]|uniref:TadE/TadG family type IV pilus assembly protein n=1 Tax=Pseudomonas batumici TaxID=226910 RepID=UPI0030CF5412
MMNTKYETGTTVVEFTLVLPLLLILLFGIIQFGWLFYNYAVLTSAASTGARLLATQRGYAAPYSDTKNAVLSAAGVIAPLATLNKALTINISVNGVLCQSDAACATALGTASQAPAVGTQASISLSYLFAPILGNPLGGLKLIVPSSLNATMSELVQ